MADLKQNSTVSLESGQTFSVGINSYKAKKEGCSMFASENAPKGMFMKYVNMSDIYADTSVEVLVDDSPSQ